MLASIRRSLVSHIEDLHVGGHGQELRKNLSRSSDKNFEGSLEGALLHLGRCIDLVRPAGLLVSSVSRSEWTKAFQALERSMSEIRLYCDPDRPLRPSEWGKLMDEDNVIVDPSEEIEEKKDELN